LELTPEKYHTIDIIFKKQGSVVIAIAFGKVIAHASTKEEAFELSKDILNKAIPQSHWSKWDFMESVDKTDKLYEVLNYLGWIAMEKYNGIRAGVSNEKGIIIVGKQGNNITDKYPDITSNIMFRTANTIIDGEIIVDSNSSKKDIKRSVFVAFDIMKYNGMDVTPYPIERRLEMLRMAIIQGKYVIIAPVYTDIKDIWSKTVILRKEGIIIKQLKSPYIGGKSNHWFELNNIRKKD